MSETIEIIISSLPPILKGLQVTLLMAVCSLFFGAVIGIALGLSRFYGGKVADFIARIYGRIIRSIPTVVMVTMLWLIITSFVDLSPLASVIVALGLHSGAYQAEIIRGAIGAVSKGEILAAQTLGMNRRQVFINVILPQLVINAIPGWSNEVAVVIKETSVGFVVGATEMLRQANYIAAVNKKFFLMYSLVGVIYLFLTFCSSRALARLDAHFRHMDVKDRGKRKPAADKAAA